MREELEIIGNPRNEKIVLSNFKLYWFERLFLNPIVQSVSYKKSFIEVHVMVGTTHNKRLLFKKLPYSIFKA